MYRRDTRERPYSASFADATKFTLRGLCVLDVSSEERPTTTSTTEGNLSS